MYSVHRQLRGESLIVHVNRVLTDREVKKDVAVSDREVKTVARELHNQLERGKKRGKKSVCMLHMHGFYFRK